jgi:hypothetical protein
MGSLNAGNKTVQRLYCNNGGSFLIEGWQGSGCAVDARVSEVSQVENMLHFWSLHYREFHQVSHGLWKIHLAGFWVF